MTTAAKSVENMQPSDLVAADLATLRQYLLDLFCQRAYREGNFKLSSGQESSYYINGKQVTLHALGAMMVGRVMLPMVPPTAIAVAGLTLGADPIVAAVSVVGVYENRPLTPLIVRKQAKGHGTQVYVEGPELPQGASVVVLEDVVTTGQSALQAVDRLRQSGYEVDQVISLVDREEGGAELYQEKGLKFEAVFSIREIQARWAELNA